MLIGILAVILNKYAAFPSLVITGAFALGLLLPLVVLKRMLDLILKGDLTLLL